MYFVSCLAGWSGAAACGSRVPAHTCTCFFSPGNEKRSGREGTTDPGCVCHLPSDWTRREMPMQVPRRHNCMRCSIAPLLHYCHCCSPHLQQPTYLPACLCPVVWYVPSPHSVVRCPVSGWWEGDEHDDIEISAPLTQAACDIHRRRTGGPG